MGQADVFFKFRPNSSRAFSKPLLHSQDFTSSLKWLCRKSPDAFCATSQLFRYVHWIDGQRRKRPPPGTTADVLYTVKLSDPIAYDFTYQFARQEVFSQPAATSKTDTNDRHNTYVVAATGSVAVAVVALLCIFATRKT